VLKATGRIPADAHVRLHGQLDESLMQIHYAGGTPDASAPLPDQLSLAEARTSFLLEMETEREATCPCCLRKGHYWKKAMVSTAARDLIRLVELFEKAGGAPVHIDEFTQQRSNFYELAKWDFVARAPNDDPKKVSSGFWLPTQSGIDFAENRAQVDKYIITYDNILIGTEGPKVSIVDVLGKKYNYDHERLRTTQQPGADWGEA
jgi:hypothetical protein